MTCLTHFVDFVAAKMSQCVSECFSTAAEIAISEITNSQQDDRIRSSSFLHRRNYLSRHRAYVGSPMSSDLGFVPHTSERDSNELPSHRFGERASDRSFARPWRSMKKENRRLRLELGG